MTDLADLVSGACTVCSRVAGEPVVWGWRCRSVRRYVRCGGEKASTYIALQLAMGGSRETSND